MGWPGMNDEPPVPALELVALAASDMLPPVPPVPLEEAVVCELEPPAPWDEVVVLETELEQAARPRKAKRGSARMVG